MKDIFLLLVSFYFIAISNAFVLANNAKSSSNSMIQMALGPLGAVTKLVSIIIVITIVILLMLSLLLLYYYCYHYLIDETISN